MESTSVIQQKGPNPKDYSLRIKGDSQKYHRSGDNPLDPTTLALTTTAMWLNAP